MKVYELDYTDNALVRVFIPGYVAEDPAMIVDFAMRGQFVREIPEWTVHRIAIGEDHGIFSAEERDNDPDSPTYGALFYTLVRQGLPYEYKLYKEEVDDLVDRWIDEHDMDEILLINGEIDPNNPPRDMARDY